MGYSFTSQGATKQFQQGNTPEPSGSTPAARALNTAQGMPPSPIPLIPPQSQNNGAIKSHSITHPDGTVVTQTFHNPEQGLLSGSKPSKERGNPMNPKTPAEPAPEIKVINGMHHVPFKASDGSVKYVNAKGEIS